MQTNSYENKGKNVEVIIHAAATSSAAVGAGLAQIPGSDMPVISGIQATMVIAIADKYNIKLSQAAAVEALLIFSAGHSGRAISQFIVGWIPGWGNAINASTAFALTEAVGWAANAHFKK